MIQVPYDEPMEADWIAWHDSAAKQQEKLQQTFRYGVKSSISEDTYKAMRQYLMRRFFDKCAYCETPIVRYTVDVEHYRPKARVSNLDRKIVKILDPQGIERDHPGYYWVVYEWKNLLPSCEFCNRKRYHEEAGASWGKETCFPVEQDRYDTSPGAAAAEVPLLIHPRFDDPSTHLKFIFLRDPSTHAPYGLITHKDRRGEVTIKLLGLDDERFCKYRAEAYIDGYTKVSVALETLRTVTAMPAEQRAPLLQSVHRIKTEVNAIWRGETAYAAYGRLGIEDYRQVFKDMFGSELPMPMPL